MRPGDAGRLFRRLDLVSAGLGFFYLCLLVPSWHLHWMGGISLVYMMPLLLALLPLLRELPPPFHLHRARRLPWLAAALLCLAPFPAFWFDFPHDLHFAAGTLAAGYVLIWLLMDLSLACLISLKGCRSATAREHTLARTSYLAVVYGLGIALGTLFLILAAGHFLEIGLADLGLAGKSLLSGVALLVFLPVPLVALLVQSTVRRLEAELEQQSA